MAKGIKFWLHRVLSEKCQDIKKLSERISVLNHQAENFGDMHEFYQKDVIKELLADMEAYGWKDAIETFKEEYGEVVK